MKGLHKHKFVDSLAPADPQGVMQNLTRLPSPSATKSATLSLLWKHPEGNQLPQAPFPFES